MEVELVTLKFKQLSLGRQPLFPLLRAWVAGDETAVTMVICAFFGLHHVLNPGLYHLQTFIIAYSFLTAIVSYAISSCPRNNQKELGVAMSTLGFSSDIF